MMGVAARHSEATAAALKRHRRVAVIGSGLAGLTTAYLLREEGVEVWIIEKSARLGFHSASVHIPVGGDGLDSEPPGPGRAVKGGRKRAKSLRRTDSSDQGMDWADSVTKDEWVVDVPMRSFQGGYYPLLIALYHHLGLPLLPADFTFSFSSLLPDRSSDTYFIYSGSSGISLPSLPARAHRSNRRLVRFIFHWIGTAISFVIWLVFCFLTYHSLPFFPRSTSLGDATSRLSARLSTPLGLIPLWLVYDLGARYTRFVHTIIVPLFSAVGTMTSADVLATPVGALVDYVHGTVGTRHYRLSADTGAREVARRLVRPVEAQGRGHVRLGTGVRGLRREMRDGQTGVWVDMHGEGVWVHEVVLATPASVASALLAGLRESVEKGEEWERIGRMREALGAVEYRETIVITHRDMSILPDRGDARDINLVLPQPPSIASPKPKSLTLAWTTPRRKTRSGGTTPSTPTPSTPLHAPAAPTPFFAPRADLIYTAGTHLIHPPAHFSAERPILQTTNPVTPIDPSKVLAAVRLERALPVRDPAVLADLAPHSHSQTPLVHLVGSYAYPGIPLLEGCVGSARRVAADIVRRAGRDEVDGAEVEGGMAASSAWGDVGSVGGVDWTTGLGSSMGRRWRWRWRKEGDVF